MQQNNNDKKPGLSWSTPSSNNTNASAKQAAPSLSLPKMSPNNGNATARYIGIFVGGLIVGVVFAWGWSALSHKSPTTTAMNGTGTVASNDKSGSTAANTNTTAKTADSKAAASVASDVSLESGELTVSSQPAGQSVSIDHATVTKPTWIVVYDDNNGLPGNVLGAQLFFTSGSGTVTLLRATQSGKTYLVGRSIDNGDHKFQKSSDMPVTDASGNMLVTSFIAQ